MLPLCVILFISPQGPKMEQGNIYVALMLIISLVPKAYTTNRIFTIGKSLSTIFMIVFSAFNSHNELGWITLKFTGCLRLTWQSSRTRNQI